MAANEFANPSELELVITRVFDAPRALVFRAWTEPSHLMQWWGPRGFTLPSCTVELRPGGVYAFQMRGADGDRWTRGTFTDVREPELLAWTGSWVDEQGKPTSPITKVTVTFEDQQGKTRVTLRQVGFESAAARDSHRGGWGSSMDRLAEMLAKK
jgi:uncharacterized protein YndB with AHSA1/START domain